MACYRVTFTFTFIVDCVGLDSFGEDEDLFSLPGVQPRPVQPKASRYTDCDIAATRHTLDQRYSTFFVRVPPHIIYLQFCTPKVVGA
jgi:hypothetical protein